MTYLVKYRDERAYALGYEYGYDSGVVASAVHASLLAGLSADAVREQLDECDGEVADLIPWAPLSGEWAGEPTPRDVYEELGMSDADVPNDDPAMQLVTTWELGHYEGFSNALLDTYTV